jgi:single-strand DNA-binding protein
LKLDTWESEGQKRSKLRVVGERLQLLGGRSGSNGASGTGESVSSGVQATNSNHQRDTVSNGPPDDEIPF